MKIYTLFTIVILVIANFVHYINGRFAAGHSRAFAHHQTHSLGGTSYSTAARIPSRSILPLSPPRPRPPFRFPSSKDSSYSPARSPSPKRLPSAPLPRENSGAGPEPEQFSPPYQKGPSSGRHGIGREPPPDVEGPKIYPPVHKPIDSAGSRFAPEKRNELEHPVKETSLTASKATPQSSSPSRSTSPKRYPKAPLPPGHESISPSTRPQSTSPSRSRSPKKYPEAPLPPGHESLSPPKSSPSSKDSEILNKPSRTASVRPGNLSPPISRGIAEPGFPKISNTMVISSPSGSNTYETLSHDTFSSPASQFTAEVVLPTMSIDRTIDFFTKLFYKPKSELPEHMEKPPESGFRTFIRNIG